MNTKIIAAAVAFFLVIGGALAGFFFYNQAEIAAVDAIGKAVEDFTEREEFDFALDTLKKGSVELNVKKIEDANTGEDVLDGATVSGKLYVNDEAVFLENFLFKQDTTKVEGSFYLSEKLIYVSEKNFLGGAYGVELESALEDYEKSIFAYGSGSEYELPEEAHNAIVRMLENPIDKSIEKDAKKLFKTVAKDIWEIICENVEIESGSETVRLNGTRKNVRVVTVTVDGEEMAAIYAEIYEYLCDSEEIIEFLEKHGETFAGAFGIEEDDSLADLYEEYLDEIEDNVEDFCELIEDTFDDELTIEIAMPKLSHKMLKLVVEYDGDNILTLDFGEDGVKKTDEINIEVGEEGEISYRIDQNDKAAYKSTLEIGDEYKINITIDKSKEKFSITCTEDWGLSAYTYKVNGGLSLNRGVANITVNKFIREYNNKDSGDKDVESYDCKIDLVVTKGDKMPDAPKSYKSIDEISEEDIDEIVAQASNVTEAYASKVNTAASSGAPYSYGKVTSDLAYFATEDMNLYYNSESGKLYSVVGCNTKSEIKSKLAASGGEVEGLIITFKDGYAKSAQYKLITTADLK